MQPQLQFVGTGEPFSDVDASLVLSLITDAVYVLDAQWRFSYVNPAAEKLLQQSTTDLVGQSHWDAFPETVDTEIEHRFRAARQGHEAVAFEVYFAPLGGVYDIRALPAGEQLVVCVRDVSEDRPTEAERMDVLRTQHADAVSKVRQATEQEAFVRGVLNSLPAATAVVDAAGRIVNVNAAWEAFARHNGADPSSVGIGASYLEVCDAAAAQGEPPAAAVATDLRAVLAGERTQAQTDYECSSPWKERWFLAQMAPIGPGLAVVTHTDITERKLAERLLTRQSSCDAMTGLANRSSLMNFLGDLLGADEPSVAVLFCDLDGFRTVNNALGHTGGDDLLCQVGDRLRPFEAKGVHVARLGGDEFVLAVPGGTLQSATDYAERVLRLVNQPYTVRGVPLQLTVSIGIALSDARHASADDLLQDADRAMYQAKATGRSRFSIFDEPMRAAAVRRDLLTAALDDAVGADQLEVHYQPILELGTMRTTGCEALLRWTHPTLGRVPPDIFIPLAEATGAIVELGRWVLDTACAHVAGQRRRTGEDLHVAVNVSPRQFADPRFLSLVRTSLAQHALPPEALVIEITETAVMTDLAAASALVGDLRALGLRVDLDDFGTGYSSLAYLRNLPVSGLKIDRSFIAALEHAPKATPDANGDAPTTADPIVPAMIEMAHALRIEVTAEGIETAEQLALPQALECDRGQGYLLGRPAPARS